VNNKFWNSDNSGNWIGVGTGIGGAGFAGTKEPTWLAGGGAIGAALNKRKPKDLKNQR